MADKRIKGLTLEIGGDTGGLSKSLGEVNKDIKGTQAELKNVERLLKLDPTNIQLLAQKQTILAKAVGLTAEKSAMLETALKRAHEQFARGEVSAEYVRKVERDTIAAGQATEGYTEKLEKCNVAMEKVAAAAQKVADKAAALGKKLTPISAAAGAAVVGMGAMAVKAGQAADDINTLSKQTGLSTEQIQKFKFASDRIDVSMDVLTGSMSKLTKNMAAASKGTGAASKAFSELRVRITNTDGSLRNNQDVFNDSIAALGKMTNETQRDAYAMQIFGKSAQDLNPLILGGADALKQMGDEAENMGLILSPDTLDEVNAFADEVDEMKAVTSDTFAAIGGEIAMAFLPVMHELSQLFVDLSRLIRTVDQDTLRMIVTILAIVASLAPLLIMIGKVATGISALSSAITFLCANPMVLLAAGFAILVAGLAYFWTTNEEFRNEFFSIWEGISNFFGTIGEFIASIFTEKIPAIMNSFLNMSVLTFVLLTELIKMPFNQIISMINGIIDAVNQAIDWVNSLTLPGFLGGGSLSIGNMPTIPMLANGGILSQGSAIVGERAPEILTLVNGKAVVQPLPGGRMGSAPGAASGNTYITNNLTIDAGNMAELNKVVKIMNGELRSMNMGYVRG